jgi:uncharacterized protein
MIHSTNKKKQASMTWKRARVILFLLFLSVMAFGYFHFSRKSPTTNDSENEKFVFQKQGELTFLSQDNRILSKLDIEIANTEYTREKGLMARATMADNQGMLFIFDYSQVQSFWMKDTILPLDMVFVDENYRIVHIAYDAVPFSETLISSEKPAQYVVEVNAGYCKKNHIGIGDKIQFKKLEEEVKE